MPKTTPGVAGFYARVGRAAAQVFAGEVFDDVLVDLFGKIQDVVRDADDLRRALGVLNPVDAAAGRLLAVGMIDGSTSLTINPEPS